MSLNLKTLSASHVNYCNSATLINYCVKCDYTVYTKHIANTITHSSHHAILACEHHPAECRHFVYSSRGCLKLSTHQKTLKRLQTSTNVITGFRYVINCVYGVAGHYGT